ncbi:leucyl aminopeptidase [Metallibacterium sp.]|jgi:leucyl aminopeptidase|uniref:leucyl aminopeptidase n=1 Tax=Metallibacterium sp. TaxID=2940281 RepID=UPI0026021BF4|nr:leucyl aminopeptidase [Metallibacterium sp.]
MTLEFSLDSLVADACEAGCIVVGMHDKGALGASAARVDAASGGHITRLIASGDCTGKAGSSLLLHALPGVRAERVLLVGLGEPGALDAARFQRVAQEAACALAGLPAQLAASFLGEIEVSDKDAAWKLRTLALAAAQHAYRYTATLKPQGPGVRLKRLVFAAAASAAQGLEQARGMAIGADFTRALANLPPNICNPAYLAERARQLAAEHPGVAVEVLERADMEKLGMGSLLAVARGSANAPKLIVLRWNGGGAAKPYALVGKGITFDTGGINLKVQGGIEEMKFDMGGAAGVLGAFLAAVELRLSINLVCVVAAVENMPDGDAYRPSDVLTTMSGKTVEVLNTDAEGRLVLCDALTYVQRFEPQAIVDAATLTGACVVALGKHASGLMSKHDDLAAELLAAGENTLDRAWRLPLWDDYQIQLESVFADFANIGGKGAGAITAGCFLARFTEGRRWAHLDIAGTAWSEGRKGMSTARPVPLLTQWLIDRAAADADSR